MSLGKVTFSNFRYQSTNSRRKLDTQRLKVNQPPELELKVPLSLRLPDRIFAQKQAKNQKYAKMKVNLQSQAESLIKNFEAKLLNREKRTNIFAKR